MKTAVTSILPIFVILNCKTKQKIKWAVMQVTILLEDHRQADIRKGNTEEG